MKDSERQNHERSGKAPERVDHLQDTSTHSGQFGSTGSRKGPSITDRIGASVSALASDAFGSSSAYGLSSGLAASMIDGGKGQSSSSSSGPSESSTSAQNFRNGPVPGLGHNHVPPRAESFRSGPNSSWTSGKQAQQDFDEFTINQGDPLLATTNRIEVNGSQPGPRSNYGEVPGSTAYTDFTPSQIGSTGKKSETPSGHAEDGAAVVSLLSDPNFCLDDPAFDFPVEDLGMAPAHPYIAVPGPDETAALNRIKAQLPQPPVHRVPSPTNPLNLIPDFNGASVNANTYPQAKATTTPNAEENYMYMTSSEFNLSSEGLASVKEMNANQEADLGQWLDVLTRYQDEVWGDMLLLVKEARSEVEQAIVDGRVDSQGGPAVRRLAMIFGHLNSSSPGGSE